jgi:uncharacterized protein involved in type VI secretion and phage assembly
MTAQPRSKTLKLGRQFFGVVSGIVEEIVDPDKEGRIKVSFRWFDEGTVTEWCRIAHLYAGKGFGTFFVPEKGTEVAIGFVHGDLREPIVLGGLYNRKLKPATDRQEDHDKDEKQIRTRAGHRITFVDTDKKRRIEIETGKGRKVVLDDDNDHIEITTGKGQRIFLDGSGKILVDAKSIELGGDAFKAVLGEALRSLFNSHTHPVGGGSTGTPTQQMGSGQLSDTVRLK